MEEERISTGCNVMDSLLKGGYEKDIITTVYGPAGSGKTNLCILASISVARAGGKTIYIDTEGNFSVSRFVQLCPDTEKLDKIIFFKPTSFEEQKKAFEKLRGMEDRKICLIIIDSIAMLYRVEIGKTQEVYEVNRELGLQLSFLTEVARKKNIPILITNQVYSSFEEPNKVNMVGGDILRYGSKCLIELQKYRNGKRKAILRKHRSIAEEKEVVFEIREKGIEGLEG